MNSYLSQNRLETMELLDITQLTVLDLNDVGKRGPMLKTKRNSILKPVYEHEYNFYQHRIKNHAFVSEVAPKYIGYHRLEGKRKKKQHCI
jgi:hypothetical protein